MEIQYYGANCVRISTKKANILVDDRLADVGGKSIAKSGDIVLFTQGNDHEVEGSKLVIQQAGEYEVSDTSIQGVAARAHTDEDGKKTATIYKIIADDVRIAFVGNIYPDLSDVQLEALGTIDILIIPVGGNGLTLDGIGALQVIKNIEPKVIIPTHYDQKGINYPVPQQPLEEALKALAMEPSEPVEKFKLKSASELGEMVQLVILEKS